MCLSPSTSQFVRQYARKLFCHQSLHHQALWCLCGPFNYSPASNSYHYALVRVKYKSLAVKTKGLYYQENLSFSFRSTTELHRNHSIMQTKKNYKKKLGTCFAYCSDHNLSTNEASCGCQPKEKVIYLFIL